MSNSPEIPKIEEYFTAEKAVTFGPEAVASGERTRAYAKELILGSSSEAIATSKDGRALLAEMLATNFAEADLSKLIASIEAKGHGGEAKMSTTLKPATPEEFDQDAQLEITKQ